MKPMNLLDRLARRVQDEHDALGIKSDTPPSDPPEHRQAHRAGVALIAAINKLMAQFDSFEETCRAAKLAHATSRPARALVAAANAASLPLEQLTAALETARTNGASPEELAAALVELPRLALQLRNSAATEAPKTGPDPTPMDQPKAPEKRSVRKQVKEPDQVRDGSDAQSRTENSEK